MSDELCDHITSELTIVNDAVGLSQHAIANHPPTENYETFGQVSTVLRA